MGDSKKSENEVEQERQRRHRLACEQGEDTYEDPVSGYQVMSEFYLLRRGYCCGSGCRHCPYPTEEKP